MFPNLTADLGRQGRRPWGRKHLYLIFEQGVWAVVFYRLACWLRGVRIPVVSWFLKAIAFALFKMNELLFGISLPLSARIGKGLYLGHFGPIILHSQVVIGEHCSLGPGVVIGTRGQGDRGVPVLGDHVYVGVGAKILGAVKVGHHVQIGANAVVLTDIPDGATAVGIPAKVIRINGEKVGP